MKIQTLLISSLDIKSVVSISDIILAVKEAFKEHAKGLVLMPSKVYLNIPEYFGDFRAMPSYIPKYGVAGLKWVTSYSRSHSHSVGSVQVENVPSVIGVYILSRAEDGYPLAIMDGTLLTELRTGAAAGVASEALARKESHTFSFIGCGKQSLFSYLALRELFDITHVRLYDIKREKSEMLSDNIKNISNTKITICESVSDCTKTSDVITTSTPSRKPIVFMNDISPGVHINALGADAKGKQELDPEILKSSVIIIDDWEQTPHSGEINVPLSDGRLLLSEVKATIGEVLIGYKQGRTNDEQITIFDSTGLAVQDLVVAKYIYNRCVEKGIGTKYEIFDNRFF